MTPEEARWLRKRMQRFKPELVLNFGSSTLAFRTVEQPFISDCFSGFNVIHVDQKPDPGVDIVADLENELLYSIVNGWLESRAQLVGSTMGVLSNVLEHVNNRNLVLNNVARLGPDWLYVSVPNEWPHHPDPIDNDFRPTPAELVKVVEWFGYRALEYAITYNSRGKIAVATFKRADDE